MTWERRSHLKDEINPSNIMRRHECLTWSRLEGIVEIKSYDEFYRNSKVRVSQNFCVYMDTGTKALRDLLSFGVLFFFYENKIGVECYKTQ